MSVGVYIRVSSRSQKSDSQHAEIRRWLEAHGYKPDAVQWFEDVETQGQRATDKASMP